jgi:hypothetical protein
MRLPMLTSMRHLWATIHGISFPVTSALSLSGSFEQITTFGTTGHQSQACVFDLRTPVSPKPADGTIPACPDRCFSTLLEAVPASGASVLTPATCATRPSVVSLVVASSIALAVRTQVQRGLGFCFSSGTCCWLTRLLLSVRWSGGL